MLKDGTLTYISLFSSAGVGCFGFKQAGFKCIATNELVERRLNIQKINNKCDFDDGYVLGDIKQESIKEKINQEVLRWKRLGNDFVDVIIATPPCQGMSVANHKKTDSEIERNSLVVESVNFVKERQPRFFVFENVAQFWKTGCTTNDGSVKAIGEFILNELARDYVIVNKIINFKNYGSKSSRTRTLVIGVRMDLSDYISPIELLPNYTEEVCLKDVIGKFKSLKWGEYDELDFYHHFRTYPDHMRAWITDLKEGECAFDNRDILKKPHKIIDDKIVINQQKNADKYTRQVWEKVAPCIHTRNDQLASQNTVHPTDDRVFSIRELMEMMTIPIDFKWVDQSMKELNQLSYNEKRMISAKDEINIRQSIGEAVPTAIFYQIASNISFFMKKEEIKKSEIEKIIVDNNLYQRKNLVSFLKQKKKLIGYASLSSIVEFANSKREHHSAFFTNKFIINEMVKTLPDFSEKKSITIIEPSVGAGNFIPLLLKTYQHIDNVDLYLCDIDEEVLNHLKILVSSIDIPKNFKLHYINEDYLLFNHPKADLIIGNPPFTKVTGFKRQQYVKMGYSNSLTNLAGFFLEKALKNSDRVCFVMPKNLLNTPEYSETRELISKMKVDVINDFGEKGFYGVLVETISILIDTNSKIGKTLIYSMTLNRVLLQQQKYIMDKKLPYWIIYRNDFFDQVLKKMEFDIFEPFRDRQLSNSNTTSKAEEGTIRVIKSRNINNTGDKIIDIETYDSFIKLSNLTDKAVFKFMDEDNVYLTPNMTYKPRVMRKEKGYVVNGSVAILIPKSEIVLDKKQLEYFSSDEYREFYQIARNYQTRSLNIDKTSCYWFGFYKGD